MVSVPAHLYLRGMQIHGNDVICSRHRQHVGHQLGRDWCSALIMMRILSLNKIPFSVQKYRTQVWSFRHIIKMKHSKHFWSIVGHHYKVYKALFTLRVPPKGWLFSNDYTSSSVISHLYHNNFPRNTISNILMEDNMLKNSLWQKNLVTRCWDLP